MKLELKIKVLRTTQRVLRIIRQLFPPSGLSRDRIIDRAYWRVLHYHAELTQRKREERRLLRMAKTKGE